MIWKNVISVDHIVHYHYFTDNDGTMIYTYFIMWGWGQRLWLTGVVSWFGPTTRGSSSITTCPWAQCHFSLCWIFFYKKKQLLQYWPINVFKETVAEENRCYPTRKVQRRVFCKGKESPKPRPVKYDSVQDWRVTSPAAMSREATK